MIAAAVGALILKHALAEALSASDYPIRGMDRMDKILSVIDHLASILAIISFPAVVAGVWLAEFWKKSGLAKTIGPRFYFHNYLNHPIRYNVNNILVSMDGRDAKDAKFDSMGGAIL